MDEGDAAERRRLQFQIQAKQVELARLVRSYILAHGAPTFLLQKEAAALRPEALTGCRVFADREALLECLPKQGIVAELGTAGGHFALEILRRCEPVELHVFDLDMDRLRPEVEGSPLVRRHIGDSSRNLAGLPDASFDWIYVDGDHSYRGVVRDVTVAVEKLKPAGVLVFNDYVQMSPMEMLAYGVVPVVNDLVADGWDVIAYALNADGYHDIALRRSAETP